MSIDDKSIDEHRKDPQYIILKSIAYLFDHMQKTEQQVQCLRDDLERLTSAIYETLPKKEGGSALDKEVKEQLNLIYFYENIRGGNPLFKIFGHIVQAPQTLEKGRTVGGGHYIENKPTLPGYGAGYGAGSGADWKTSG